MKTKETLESNEDLEEAMTIDFTCEQLLEMISSKNAMDPFSLESVLLGVELGWEKEEREEEGVHYPTPKEEEKKKKGEERGGEAEEEVKG